MDDRAEIRRTLMEVVGEEGCGASCEDADLFHDEEGWKLQMCSFVGAWKLGGSVDEAKAAIRELGAMGSGLA